MAHYEPVASIPASAQDLNFTYGRDGMLKRKRKKELELLVPIHKIS
jgi:hypothetical protein